MARSQTNLTIGIGVDTSKFIADAAIVKKELRDIKKEVDAAARAGDVGRLQAASAEQARLTQQYAALNREIRGVTAAHKEAVPVFNQLGGAFALMRSNTLLVTGAISGVVFALGKLVSSAAKSVDAIEDVAEAAGIAKNELLAMQLAGAKVGSTAEDVNQGVLRQTRAIGAERKERRAAQREYNKQMDERKKKLDEMSIAEQLEFKERERREGTMPTIAEGTGPFAELGIDVTAKTNAQIRKEAAIALLKIEDAADRADKAQAIFGKNWAKQIELLAAGRDMAAEAAKELARLGVAITPQESAQATASLESMARFALVLDRTMAKVGNTISVAVVPILNGLTEFIAANQPVWQQWAEVIAGAMTTVRFAAELLWLGFRTLVGVITGSTSELGKAADSFVASWDGAFKWFGNAVNTVIQWFDWIIEKGKEAAGFLGLGGGTGAGGAVTVPVTGKASGGYISGPGTGTSDSILARLSNGEFVLNAASVRRLGVGFLHGLNSFAAGGLVGMPPIRFAEGGLASAGGGTPVHLHLGSHSFALAGQAGVVKALVSEAHAQQVRSAGVKPSWFAGRPSGR